MITSDQEIKYTYLFYHPMPEAGTLGNKMIVALVAFPIPQGRGRLWLQKGRIASIAVFGRAEHREEVVEFVASLRANLETCEFPEHALDDVRAMLMKENYIVQFSEYRVLPQISLCDCPEKLNFEVEKENQSPVVRYAGRSTH